MTELISAPSTPCSHALPSIRPALRTLKETIIGTTAPQESVYASEIFACLRETETPLPADCLSKQSAVNFKMRAVLVDWLVSLHLKFKLAPETLHLCTSLLDRYLAVCDVTRAQLQLVGVTALLVAAKYEEIYPPEAKDFLHATDFAYSRKQLKLAEVELLNALDFAVTKPTAWHFLERFAACGGLSASSKLLAEYLCELALVEYHMLRYKASLQAAAATYVAIRIQRKEAHWGVEMAAITGYSEQDLRECVRDQLVLFQAAPKHTLTAVREKYSRPQTAEVAKMRLL